MDKQHEQQIENGDSCMYRGMHVCPTCGSHQELVRNLDGAYIWMCSNKECFAHSEDNFKYNASSGV